MGQIRLIWALNIISSNISSEICFQNPFWSLFAFSIYRTCKKVSCSPPIQSHSSCEADNCVIRDR